MDSAHPRSRGENNKLDGAAEATPGSSPLTRGKPTTQFAWMVGGRLIPAHAGKTIGCACGLQVPRAHPRSRGENGSEAGDEKGSTGSSPLTRGKPVKYADLIGMLRLIPAHAGKTRWPGPGSCRCPAHPRSRGENHRDRLHGHGEWGSSPLTRGKLDTIEALVSQSRLIPAHAGKTCHQPATRHFRAAHPRSRGENVETGVSGVADFGSSPLTRGKLVPGYVHHVHQGLIPAHAGKTTSSSP